MATLLERFITYNREKRLAGPHKRVLLAVSGGADSVVMLDLFAKSGFPFAVAHANFQLRGEESEGDAQLVEMLSRQYGGTFYSTKFDTTAYAEQHKLSIQEAARVLRYEWFHQLKKESARHPLQRIDLIATAHHLNDNIETILYNFTKGTGLKGLRGIPERNGSIIRPLLFATREEIAAYAGENKLVFREDSSNASDKYARNKIRHHVIPVLKEINPSLEQTIFNRIEQLKEIEEEYQNRFERLHKKLFIAKAQEVHIPIKLLQKVTHAESTLFEFLQPYGFSRSQVADVMKSLIGEAGKQFKGQNVRLIKDRKFLLLVPDVAQESTTLIIEENDREVKWGNKVLLIEKKVVADVPKMAEDPTVAYIDAAEISFPLVLRKRKEGDYLYPLGMGMKKKKLKKLLNDYKVPLHEKENIGVLESNHRIVWVVGYRMDERFKVKLRTGEVYVFRVR